jgi:hypothetical protein
MNFLTSNLSKGPRFTPLVDISIFVAFFDELELNKLKLLANRTKQTSLASLCDREIFGGLMRLILTVILIGLVSLYTHSAGAMDISWNGFGSFYYGQALSSDVMPIGLPNTHPNFTNYSLVGLNFGGEINDDLKVVAQFVALGSPVGSTDSFGLMAQWAYVNYTPASGTSIKIGRQLEPVLIASEYIRVGYLLPFQKIPAVVSLNIPLSRFDGVSINQSYKTSVGQLTFGLFGGSPLIDINQTLIAGFATLLISDLYGAQVTLDGDGWRLHANGSIDYARISYTANPNGTLEAHSRVLSAGYRYDKNNLVSWGEYVLTSSQDGTPVNGGRFLGSSHAGYLLVGYRLGNLMPRYTFAQAETANNTTTALGTSTNGQLISHTLGLNWQIGQVVAKIDYEHDVLPSQQGSAMYFNQSSTSTATASDALFTGLDFIF